MPVTIEDIFSRMITAMGKEAGSQWKKIRTAATNETQVFLQRLAKISAGRATGQLSKEDASDFFAMALNNLVSMIAMSTALVRSAVQRIVNAGIDAVKAAINGLVGFALLI